MATTIQIKEDVKASLDRMKMFERETYNDVLEHLLEDMRELDEGTKKDIQKAIKEIEGGKFKTHGQLKTEMGL